ncbi:MAG: MopE-related protein [Pseudomonadota bacterium]
MARFVHPLPWIALLVSMSAPACAPPGHGDWFPSAPDVTLAGSPDTVVRGMEVTFAGSVTDAEQPSDAISVAWTFAASDGRALDLELAEDCAQPPADTDTVQGHTTCTFRTPTDLAELMVVLSATDSSARSGSDHAAVLLEAGGAPSCALVSPTAVPPDGAYFSDRDVLVDGACADIESTPADLELWFQDTYLDEDGQPVVVEYRPGDGEDTASPDLYRDTGDEEARLYGYLSLPPAEHRICLYAQDESANTSGEEGCVTIEVLPPNTAPLCEILLPEGYEVGAPGDIAHLIGLVEDEQDPGTLLVTWHAGTTTLGTSTPTAEGHVRLDTVLSDFPGEVFITLQVQDAWGSLSHCTSLFQIHNGPAVTILSPLDEDQVDLDEVLALEGVWDDGQTACADLSIVWRSSLVDEPLYEGPAPTGSCEDLILYDPALLGPLPEGWQLITLHVTDEDGQTNADGVWIQVGDCARDWYPDADGDGYGDSAAPVADCTQPSGTVGMAGDCDDGDAAINPDAVEACDGLDNNCNGDIEEGFPYPYDTIFCPDNDGDGLGGPPGVTGCVAPSGYVPNCDDCDDTDASINPSAVEACNTGTPVDEDCDGLADPVGAAGCVIRYPDLDGDGCGPTGDPGACVCLSNPYGYTAALDCDCDDSDPLVVPGATEVCNGLDDDCDGATDPENATGCVDYYYDADGDGFYATGAPSRCLCAPDGAYGSTTSGDCDDADVSIHPGAAEVCDTLDVDEDCDGLADDDDASATGQASWYRDADGDGYGLASVALARCDQPSGYVADASDCDDGCDTCHPGAGEVLLDGFDNDCDGEVDECGHSLSACTATSAALVSCCIEALGSAGGTVTLDWTGESSFDETIELVSNLTIEGQGEADTILTFAGDQYDKLMVGTDTSNVTLRDFSLYGTRTTADCTCSTSGDSCDPTSGRTGATCDGESQGCIVLEKDATSGISGLLIEDVGVKYCWQYGLHIKYATDVKIDGLTAGYNGYYRAYDHNVYIYKSDNVLITDSGSRYSAGHGVNIRGCHDVVVHDTTVGYNHHSGIRVSGESSVGEDATDILLDNTDSFGNDDNGVEFTVESGYNVHRACVENSAIEDNNVGVYFYYLTGYQRSGNTYSGNGTQESIASSSLDTSVCASLPTSSFTWAY